MARSQRNTTALFGAGLIDSIPDGVIEAAAARRFPEFPGIQGRVSRSEDGKIGRFGWKGQMPTLGEFVLTACAVELGLEVPDHRQGGDPLEPEARAKGLDLTAGECDALVAFVASLPAPRRQVPTGAAEVEAIREGEISFGAIGCATCHTPDLGEVEGLYSDLLLHDMGTDGSDTGSYGAFRPSRPNRTRRRSVPSPGDRRGRESTEPVRAGASGGPRRCGACAIRVPTCTTVVPTRSTRRSPCTAARGRTRRRGIWALAPGRQRVRAFLKSLVAPVDPPPARARLARR